MRRIMLAAALVMLALPALAQYKPGPENVALPKDYATNFIRYATVDKADRKIIRYLFVNPEAFGTAKAGTPLPDGTVIVMEDHAARLAPDGIPLLDQQGRFIANPAILAIAIQEKRNGWGVGYPAEVRNGEWEYGRFNADGSRNPGPVAACFDCHIKVRSSQDFAFNFWDYLQTRK
ncbi:MAG: cytochrome P460 family protein [Alphaproteobacteria bacterium]|nr:cytochrome P460 family protein [Alphaproteobacteria bacterium]